MATKWHTLPLSDVERKLGTDLHAGLSNDEAQKRREVHGPNELPAGRPDPLYLIFFRQFQSPLIYILLAASAIVFFLGDIVDGFVILFVLIFNAVIGAIQEGKAQDALLALRKFAETQAAVLRSGTETIVADRELVPGDVIVLQAGDRVPADARVLESKTLQVDEAALTGESLPVHKQEAVIADGNVAPGELLNMVFKGTSVTSGLGKAVVVATGLETEIGKISQEIAVIDTEIPLKKDIRNLSRFLLWATALISATFFLSGVYLGRSVEEMFTTVVALAVSFIPEGLPLVLTIVLAAGVWRMARRNALIKKMQAVEALGQAQVIAVDKTGTITRNEMIVREVFVGGKTYFIGGTGYEPKGEVRMGENIIDPANHGDLLLAGKLAAFCASARAIFSNELGRWRVTGDPTEAAMAVVAEKIGFHKDDIERESPIIHELPFDYKNKYHATVHRVGDKNFITVAGAPEAVLELAEKILWESKEEKFDEKRYKEIEKIFHDMSRRGLRVVAFAFKEVPKETAKEIEKETLKGLTFGGFYGMADSLRPEVPEAVQRAKDAGIKVVMITGDHRLTAEAIAKQAGIWEEGSKVLTGADIDILQEEALAQELAGVSVFARVTPEHKMKIIKAYRKRGEIIAMTGDGVNDAPSLVAADLGVAMGKIGTDVAKEAADIVLLDDNFGSIVSAVEEGRSMFKTIQKVVLFLISTNLGEVVLIAVAIFGGLPLPLLPVQILWLNLVSDPFPGAALAMEPKEDNLLGKTFKRRSRGIVDDLMVWRTILMLIPMAIGAFYLFKQYYLFDLAKAQTIALTSLAVFQWLNAWNVRSETESILGAKMFANRFLIWATLLVAALQLLVIYLPPLQAIFHTVPLSLREWGWILLIALSIIVVEEARKAHVWAKEKYRDEERRRMS